MCPAQWIDAPRLSDGESGGGSSRVADQGTEAGQCLGAGLVADPDTALVPVQAAVVQHLEVVAERRLGQPARRDGVPVTQGRITQHAARGRHLVTVSSKGLAGLRGQMCAIRPIADWPASAGETPYWPPGSAAG